MILYVGRLVHEKGVNHLLDAFAIVAERFKNAILYIIGTGPQKAALESQAQDLGVANSTVFVGHVRNELLPDWYRAANLSVMPSFIEWFGMVAAESMACGTPVIATDAGGAVDIIREFECGSLIPPRDSEALAHVLILHLSGDRTALPNIARARNVFHWTAKLENMMSFFRSRMARILAS
jgi:1,4-alpha-glucan branching enzyme